MIPRTRALAAERQQSARVDGQKMGIKLIKADPKDLAKMRALLLKDQPRIVKELKMDPELVAKTQAYLDKLM